jgi:hypothetical protein
MNVNDIFPTRFVSAADLNGKSFTLTIRSVTLEDMQSHDNKTVTKPVAWFTNAAKGLVLNRTNTMIIADLYGPETDAWAGKRITIYATKVRAFGKMEDAIRVREEKPAPTGSPLGAPAAASAPADEDDAAAGLPTADASIWDTATPSSKSPDDASPAQLLRLTRLMAQAYGTDWGRYEAECAQQASKGAVDRFSDLKAVEATVLERKLETGVPQSANGKVAA